MEILWTVIVGFIVGVLAKLLHPGRDNLGFIMTVLLGIGGSVFASYAGQAVGFYRAGEGAGFVGAVLGAVAILVIYGLISGQPAPADDRRA